MCIIMGDKIIPPANIEIQTAVITFLNCLYKFILRNMRLKKTKTKPIVWVKRIRKLNIAYRIKLRLTGCFIHFIVYKRFNAEKKNSI